MISTILVILAILTIGGIAYNIFRADELDEREEDLDKYSVHLDERANKLALWEEELIKWEKEARK